MTKNVLLDSEKLLFYLRDTKLQLILSFLLGSMLLVFFRSVMISFGLVILLLFMGMISQAYKIFIPVNTGFELMTFVSVLFMFAYNPVFGLMAAFLMTLVSAFFVTRRVGVGLLFKLMAYAMMALIAFLVMPLGLVAGGILMVIVYNAFVRGVLSMGGANKYVAAASLIVNLGLNYYLLSNFGPTLINLL